MSVAPFDRSGDAWGRSLSERRAPVDQPLSRAAVTSLVFGVIAVVPLALLFGVVGLVATRRRGTRRGRGLAIAGLALAVVWSGVLVGFVALVASAGPDRDATGRVTGAGIAGVSDLRQGDCVRTPTDLSRVATLQVVPCGRTHDAEVIAIVTLPDGPWDPTRVQEQSQQQCRSAATTATASGGSVDLLAYFPQQAGWDDGDRTTVCLVAGS